MPSPVDGTVWGTIRANPGAVVRLNPGTNPPETALAEIYNVASPGFGPRGGDIDSKGVVSEEVAASLAEGIRERTNASLGVSITGLAGPGGSPPGPDAEKPVGRVYVGLADGNQTIVKELDLAGDRDRIRYWASQHALELIRRHLL